VRIDVLTIFPGMFEGVIGEGMLRIAREKGLLDVRVHDLRNWTKDRHRSVDDEPFGGGPGMVMKVEPVVEAIEEIEKEGARGVRVLLCPQGEPFRQAAARELAATERIVMIAGHYEGYDERIRVALEPKEISIGDYVVSGGELPALVVMDAVARLLPGVVGDPSSIVCESFEDGLLDYPQYTRPREYRGMAAPAVLLSGNHEEIRRWRDAQRVARTRERRSDLLSHENKE